MSKKPTTHPIFINDEVLFGEAKSVKEQLPLLAMAYAWSSKAYDPSNMLDEDTAEALAKSSIKRVRKSQSRRSSLNDDPKKRLHSRSGNYNWHRRSCSEPSLLMKNVDQVGGHGKVSRNPDLPSCLPFVNAPGNDHTPSRAKCNITQMLATNEKADDKTVVIELEEREPPFLKGYGSSSLDIRDIARVVKDPNGSLFRAAMMASELRDIEIRQQIQQIYSFRKGLNKHWTEPMPDVKGPTLVANMRGSGLGVPDVEVFERWEKDEDGDN